LSDKSLPWPISAFGRKETLPENLWLYPKRAWNERICVETAFALVTMICDLKRIRHRLAAYLQTRLSFVGAMFNVLLDRFQYPHPDADHYQTGIAEFSL